jgi:hypothetical protein
MEGYDQNDVKVMPYFDEVHVLEGNRALSPDGRNMYDVLCSCFNDFLRSPVFVIYFSAKLNICQVTL